MMFLITINSNEVNPLKNSVRLLLMFLAMATMPGCASISLQNSWKDPGATAKQYRKLLVVGVADKQQMRQVFEAGIRDVGENYTQEMETKLPALANLPLCWHFIGPIQSNKTRFIASHCDWVHTLNRLKVAERLNAQRPAGLPPLNACIQINIDGSATKSGVNPEALPRLASDIAKLQHLRLRGLMAIPDPSHDTNRLKYLFGQMQRLFRQLQCDFPDCPIDTLSLGMSADLELAIAAGSTLVRVGTGIFGART